MSTWAGGWRVALRVARRDLRRHRGTALLAILMIGLPIAGACAADVLVTTNQPSDATQITRANGQADASFALATPGQALVQNNLGTAYAKPSSSYQVRDVFNAGQSGPVGPTTTTTVAEQISQVKNFVPGATSVTSEVTAKASMSSTHGQMSGLAWEYDIASPMATGRYRLLSGMTPRSANEVFVTKAMADGLKLSPGSSVTVNGHSGFTVSGIGYVLGQTTTYAAVIGQPGAFGLANMPGSQTSATIFVAASSPIGASVVQAANAQGWLVTSQYFATHPTADSQNVTHAADANKQAIALLLGLVGLFMVVQIILLAGPAFAVSARRQRHDLAIASASGAPPAQLRRTVLAGGVVVGVLGGVGGAAVGLAVGLLLAMPWGNFRIFGTVLGPVIIPWAQLVLLAVVGLVAASLAALFPALSASRHEARSALSSAPRLSAASRRVVPILGAVFFVAGAATAWWLEWGEGTFANSNNLPMLMALGALAFVEAGMIMLIPSILRLLGRFGGRLPLLFRLASRDAARSTGRTAPGVAAVMAIMAVAFGTGIGINSWNIEAKNWYQPQSPLGQMTASFAQLPTGGQTAQAISDLESVQPVSGAYAVHVPSLSTVSGGEASPITDGSQLFAGRSMDNGSTPTAQTLLSFTPVRTDSDTCPLTPSLSTDATATTSGTSEAAKSVPTTTAGATIAQGALTSAGTKIAIDRVFASPADITAARTKPQCDLYDAQNPIAGSHAVTPPPLVSGIAIDDGSAAAVLAPDAQAQVKQALSEGKVVVFSPYDASNGQALIQKSVISNATAPGLHLGLGPTDPFAPEPLQLVTQRGGDQSQGGGQINKKDVGAAQPDQAAPDIVGLSRVSVPAVVVSDPNARAIMIVPPSLAANIGMTPMTSQIIETTTTMPSLAQGAEATQKMNAIFGAGASLNVERGYYNNITNAFPIALGASWVLCLLVVIVASALALADAKRDLSISAAIGATPGLRRRLAAVNALTLSIIGVVAGFVAGLVAVIGIIGYSSHQCASGISQCTAASGGLKESGLFLQVPWGWVGLLAIGVPVLAALCMAVFTRPRIGLLPRAE